MVSGNTKNFELKLGKTGLVILVVGMVVLLCGAFWLGVDVGKNIDTYPATIAALPGKLLAQIWRPSSTKIAPPASARKTQQGDPKTTQELDLTFYNRLTSKKGAVGEQPILEKKSAAETAEAKTTSPSVRSDGGLPPAASDKDKKQQAAEDVIAAKIQEAEEAAAAKTGKYSVQVASSKEKAKAGQISKKLSALGYASRVVENNIPKKGRWFRVVIDGFATKAKAEEAAVKINNKTGATCIVRRTGDGTNGNN